MSLPLHRHDSRDSDEENFGFDQAKTELQEILNLSDLSTHNGPDAASKERRSAWWEGRAALDSRLKNLLTNMETLWLGGFRGVFSQHIPFQDHLSRFQGSLYSILDKYLPSRQTSGKRSKSPRIDLDPRVIELFVALEHPTNLTDMEEPLLDLLYFVVDILQFHGERNAYDEIDFDSVMLWYQSNATAS